MQQSIGFFFGKPDLVVREFVCDDPQCPQLKRKGKPSVFETQKALNAHRKSHPHAALPVTDGEMARACALHEAFLLAARLQPQGVEASPDTGAGDASGEEEEVVPDAGGDEEEEEERE